MAGTRRSREAALVALRQDVEALYANLSDKERKAAKKLTKELGDQFRRPQTTDPADIQYVSPETWNLNINKIAICGKAAEQTRLNNEIRNYHNGGSMIETEEEGQDADEPCLKCLKDGRTCRVASDTSTNPSLKCGGCIISRGTCSLRSKPAAQRKVSTPAKTSAKTPAKKASRSNAASPIKPFSPDKLLCESDDEEDTADPSPTPGTASRKRTLKKSTASQPSPKKAKIHSTQDMSEASVRALEFSEPSSSSDEVSDDDALPPTQPTYNSVSEQFETSQMMRELRRDVMSHGTQFDTANTNFARIKDQVTDIKKQIKDQVTDIKKQIKELDTTKQPQATDLKKDLVRLGSNLSKTDKSFDTLLQAHNKLTEESDQNFKQQDLDMKQFDKDLKVVEDKVDMAQKLLKVVEEKVDMAQKLAATPERIAYLNRMERVEARMDKIESGGAVGGIANLNNVAIDAILERMQKEELPVILKQLERQLSAAIEAAIEKRLPKAKRTPPQQPPQQPPQSQPPKQNAVVSPRGSQTKPQDKDKVVGEDDAQSQGKDKPAQENQSQNEIKAAKEAPGAQSQTSQSQT